MQRSDKFWLEGGGLRLGRPGCKKTRCLPTKSSYKILLYTGNDSVVTKNPNAHDQARQKAKNCINRSDKILCLLWIR
jgi:hypothetical protein